MASSSSAVNDSVILTEDDIPGASLAGRNPSSLKNEELRFWLRCREDSLKGLKTKALLVKRYAQCIDFNSSLTVISYKYFFLIRFAEWRNTWKVDAIKWWLIPIGTKFVIRHHPAWNTQAMAGEILWIECLHSPVQKWISILRIQGKKSRASNIILFQQI